MSLLKKIQAEQVKQKIKPNPSARLRPVEAPEFVSVPKTVPVLNAQAERQTRQLGYRVSVETVRAFENYRDQVNAIARSSGLQRQSFGELAELALRLLMEHDPKEVLGAG